jgi:hypothetical protein
VNAKPDRMLWESQAITEAISIIFYRGKW